MLQKTQSASKETKLRSPKCWDRVIYTQRTFQFVGDLYEKRGTLLSIDKEKAEVLFDEDITPLIVELAALEVLVNLEG